MPNNSNCLKKSNLKAAEATEDFIGNKNAHKVTKHLELLYIINQGNGWG